MSDFYKAFPYWLDTGLWMDNKIIKTLHMYGCYVANYDAVK